MDLSFKQLRTAFLILIVGFLLSLLRVQTLTKKNENLKNTITSMEKEIDSLQNQNDSLTSEIFPCEVELNRFQIAYEIFLRRNPKAASQYGDIISEETE